MLFWSNLMFFGIWFGIPILILRPRIRKCGGIGKRVVISIFATWIGMVLHMEFIHFPIAQDVAEAQGNDLYDGVPARGLLLLFGWIYGIIGTVAAACGYKIVQHVRKKRHSGAA